jgi:hypothetical protein
MASGDVFLLYATKTCGVGNVEFMFGVVANFYSNVCFTGILETFLAQISNLILQFVSCCLDCSFVGGRETVATRPS